MAHDFANTLGAIMGYASALLEELPRRERHYSGRGADPGAAHRARRLTESLLRFSGPGERSLEPVALGGSAHVTGMLRRSIPRGVDVKLRLAAGTLVDGDAAPARAVPE